MKHLIISKLYQSLSFSLGGGDFGGVCKLKKKLAPPIGLSPPLAGFTDVVTRSCSCKHGATLVPNQHLNQSLRDGSHPPARQV